jgi:hypothetical protein
MNRIFITGMGRSGTTLIDKLLTNHKDIELLTQPFPLIFTFLKSKFLEKYNRHEYYVLNGNACENEYSIDKFNLFLSEYKLNFTEIISVFDQMKTYSGQITKINIELTRNSSYSFLELYDLIIKQNLINHNVKYIGSKEIICEEFIPFLLQNNTKVILVIRDPKDVVASINYPTKTKYFGDKKPLLFILRNWRRSIDYLQCFENKSNFMYIRYEDLVCDTFKSLDNITNFLDLTSFDHNQFDNGILDRYGKVWKSNTSYEQGTSFISSSSIGAYKKVLTQDEINYIETICYKEMRLLNYTLDTNPNSDIIQNFKDTNVKSTKYLDKNYTSSIDNINQEIKRYIQYANK